MMKGSTLDYKIIEKHEVPDIWNNVKDIISQGLVSANDLLNDEDVLNYLNQGLYTLWIATEPDSDSVVAAMTIQYAYYPKYKMCRVATIAGQRMSEWIGDLYMLENWAKTQGCDYMDLYARRGWKKVLKEYKEDCILLRKKL